MARQPLRFVRASAAQVAEYTGPAGEPVFNADAGALHVQDGQTPGGIPLATRGQLAQDLLTRAPAEFEAAPGVTRGLITAVQEIRTLRSFGVVGNGIADDTARVQAAFNYMKAGGYVIDTIGLKCRITGEIDCHPTKAYKFVGAGRNRTVFLIDFSGFDKAGLKLTHPTNPLQRGETCHLSHFSVWYSENVVQTPCALEYRSCSGLFLYDVSLDQWSSWINRGTILRLSGVWNSVIRSISCWSGGCFRSSKLIPKGTRFSTNTSVAKVAATNPVFTPDTVGTAFQLDSPIGGEQFIIWGVSGDGLTADVDHVPTYAFPIATTVGCFDGVKVIESTVGSNVIKINGGGAVTDSDIGRVIYISMGRANKQHYRGKITAAAAAVGHTQLITLDKPLEANPHDRYVVFSPIVEIYAETLPNGSIETTNDIVFDDLAMEAGAGVPLLIADGYNLRFTQCKSHALNPGYYADEFGTTHHATLACAVFFNSSASFVCEAEGQHNNKIGQIWVHGLTGAFHLHEKVGYIVAGQRILSLRGHHRTSFVDIGHVKNDAYSPPYLTLIDTDYSGGGIHHYGTYKDTTGWPRKLDLILFQMGQDKSQSRPLPCRRGRLQITTTSDLNRACIVDFFFDNGNSGAHQVTSNSLIEVRNVSLTGTTGDAGKITISVTPDGLLYIENRLSSYEECHVRVEMGMNG